MMKKFLPVLVLLIVIVIFPSCNQFKKSKANNQLSELKGPYLGQKSPGIIPEIFAPGIISTQEFDEYGCSFTPDLNQFYFTRTLKNPRRHQIFFAKNEENKWIEPQLFSFTTGEQSGEPLISPDGKLMLFGKLIHDTINKSMHSEIWFSKYEDSEWTQPKYLINGMYATISKNNTIYYTDLTKGFKNPIISKAVFEEDKIISVEALPEVINAGNENAHPYIHPDEKFILFDSNKAGGYGNFDLYISFNNNGVWTKPVNLGPEINTEHYESIPYISPDGNFLFFCRYKEQGDIYWLDTKIIYNLKPNYLK